MTDELIITKILTTRCIGYQRNKQGGVDSVFEETVLFADGTTGTVYGINYHLASGHTRYGAPTRTKPRIDTASAIVRKDTAQ